MAKGTAVVTGASSGIGRVLVDLLAKDGHDVFLVARREQQLNAIAADVRSRFGVKAHVAAVDLAKPGAARVVLERTREEDLDVDVLVNNAGFAKYGEFATSDLSVQSEMIATNVTSLVELTRLFLDVMLPNKKGRILQLASTAAFQPGPRMAVYYATKAFVLSFSEAIAHELEGTGVTVTTLCPGPTRTEFNDVANFKLKGFQEFASMDAEQVALAGYRGMMRGDRVVVPGAHNKLGAFGAQIGPRGLVTKVVASLTRSRE